jgi:Na+-transporting methylmalonyl-CoA/oxaloacetate decarboxylase gamma subunit
MNLHHLKWKKESIPVVLLGAAVVFTVLILIQVTSFLEASARVQNTIKKAVAQDGPSPDAMRVSAAASQAVAQELKKHNLFSPPQPPRHPVTSVLGILGGEALIGNKWYRAGDMVGDAKIVAVEPTRVRILWQGHEKVFVPMDVAGQPGTSGARPVRRVFRPRR